MLCLHPVLRSDLVALAEEFLSSPHSITTPATAVTQPADSSRADVLGSKLAMVREAVNTTPHAMAMRACVDAMAAQLAQRLARARAAAPTSLASAHTTMLRDAASSVTAPVSNHPSDDVIVLDDDDDMARASGNAPMSQSRGSARAASPFTCMCWIVPCCVAMALCACFRPSRQARTH